MQSLIKIKKKKGMTSLCGLHQGQTEADFSNQGLGAQDAKLIASDIQDMGLLSKLDISKNQICEACRANLTVGTKYDASGFIALSKALKSTSIKQLNIAENNLIYNQQGSQDMSGVIKFAEDMKDMGSLSKFTFSGDHRESKPVTVEVGMTEADFSGALLQQSGAMILAGWLKHKVQHDSD